MKKIILSIIALLAVAGAYAQSQSWSFTSISDDDYNAIIADEDWEKVDDKDRYHNLKALASAPLTAGGTELNYAKGLLFTANAKGIRVDRANKRLALNGSDIAVTIPNLKEGQVVNVVTRVGSSSALTRYIEATTNLTVTAGFTASSKYEQITNTATVTADGDVTFTTKVGAIELYSITVSNPSSQGGGDDITTEEDYSTTSNLNTNQAILTLKSGNKRFYNTSSLSDITIDDSDVTVNRSNDGGSYTFNGNVVDIAFRKAENGQSGEVTNTDNVVNITEAKGWLESAYVKFDLFEGAKSYNVYIKGGQYSDYTKIDQQLVRNYGTYGRADVVGLKAATDYAIKVVPVNENDEEMTANANKATDIPVKNYDRQGFAHKGVSGIGAYNDDGTLKSGGIVLYITKNNFNTVSLDMIKDNKGGTQTYTGLGEIMYGKQKGYDTRPLAIRIIGEIKNTDADANQLKSDEDGLELKGNSDDTEMNVTLEGIGDDATFNGFGMTFNKCTKMEMRNLGIINFNDDAIQLKTAQHAWIHHNDIFYGSAGSDADQAKGDGSMDVKDNSRYCTFSYNHFWDSGKTSLCGMKSESGDNWLCYHHNWFDHSDSRHPRVRRMSVHVWNNFYDGVSKIGVGAVAGANIFVENNYFRNSKNPMLISEQGTDGRDGFAEDHDGGMIKAYGNILTGKAATTFISHKQNAIEFDAYVAESRDEQVPNTYKSVVGNYTYNNFDTNASLMYEYTPDAADDVPAVVTSDTGAGRMNHGDLQWTFNNAIDDTKDAIDSELKSKVTNYRTTLVGIFGDENASSGESGSEGGEGGEGGESGGGGDTPTGTILASFDGAPSISMFTVAGSYYDGKITYDGNYYKKGVKFNSEGSIAFTPTQNYNMIIIMGTAKDGRNVKINGTATTVSGTTSSDGTYYELEPIAITANTQYVLTKGSGEGLVMLIKLVPVDE